MKNAAGLARGAVFGARIRAPRRTAMRRASFATRFFLVGGTLYLVNACGGPTFTSAGGDDGAATGGSSSSGGTAQVGGNGATGGDMPSGGEPDTGGSIGNGGALAGQGGRASGGTAPTGGSSGGLGGAPAAGTAGNGGGGAGVGPGGGGAGIGGAGSGGAGRAGSAGVGGASAGAAGAPDGCANMPSCEACCEERYPMGHGSLAGTYYSCGCAPPCGIFCTADTFCSSVYYWGSDCIGCMLQTQSTMECVSATNACNNTPLCQSFRACLLSCF
jgi:hypothetical protein